MSEQNGGISSQPRLLQKNKSSEKEKRESEKPKSKPGKFWCGKYVPCILKEAHVQKSMILVGLCLILAVLLTPSFTVDNPSYLLGDIADRNIRAKQDFLIPDDEATSKKREEAVKQAPVVYDLDELAALRAKKLMESAFQQMRDSLDPPSPSQSQPQPQSRAPESASSDGGAAAEPPSQLINLASLNPGAVAQPPTPSKKTLENLLGFQMTDRMYSDLVRKRFSPDIQDKVLQLIQPIISQGIVANKAKPPEFRSDNVIIRKLGAQEEMASTSPHNNPDVEEARKYVRMQALGQGWDARDTKIVTFLATQLLQPNFSLNRDETMRRREQAQSSVKPVYIQLLKNEMLVREGQRIGADELLKLRAYERKAPSPDWILVFASLFLFCGLCVWVVVNVSRQHLYSPPVEVQDFIFLGLLMVFLLTLGRSTMGFADIVGESSPIVSGKTLVYAIPLTAGAMMTSIFFGVTVSLVFSLLLTLFAGMLFGKDFGLYFYFLIGSFVAAHGVSPCRNRLIPIKAGLLVGGVNVALIVLSAFLHNEMVPLRMLINTFFGFCGGVFAGILVIGLTPLVELAFSYTTDIKLLELATMDQPLLQELMVQAPGTYHHSIIVGNMVEASAKSIGANSLLAKVAAYYHDIGKIRKPLYFIENQFDCENRHEKLAPSMSSLILTSHVKEGVELARQHRLGKTIIDIIKQHHGSSFISFFYKKAQEAREKTQSTKGAELPPVNVDDYRYPGPKPQTKEAGLVMLADVVEAACRSLMEPTPARIQGMVNRLINNIFSDGQLDECELTLKDLHHIAKHFNQILATVHHKRIEYPSVSACDARGRPDASDPGQRESRQDRDKSAANREGGRKNLRRLGIH
jgi:putative nucleotidyltransferase with HDIG domain